MSGFAYFICEMPSQSDRLVKIGWARDPMRRVAELQCGNPRPLWILGVVEAHRRDESWAHRQLWRFRVHGEWFRLPNIDAVCGVARDADIEDVINAAINGTPTAQEPIAA